MNKLHKITQKSNSGALTVRNEDETIDVMIKFDGCVHFNQFWNGDNANTENSENCDYIHICKVDEMIELLQEIKLKAKEYFKNEYWK